MPFGRLHDTEDQVAAAAADIGVLIQTIRGRGVHVAGTVVTSVGVVSVKNQVDLTVTIAPEPVTTQPQAT